MRKFIDVSKKTKHHEKKNINEINNMAGDLIAVDIYIYMAASHFLIINSKSHLGLLVQ